MDSVLSSNQNEQVASNGRKTAESIVEDTQDELDDSHQRLLFGGTTAPATESREEAGLISSAVKVGSLVERARDTSSDLNLVAISGVTSPPPRLDVKPISTPVESNPLPAIANSGVASTVSLYSSSAENVVPSGRRSGASDKIAVQLASDSTPLPLIPTGIRMADLDPATRRNVAQNGVYGLFGMLETGNTGTKDTNAPVVSTAATRRRSGEPAPEISSENSTIAASGSPISRPLADPRTSVDSRVSGDTRTTSEIRTSTDNRQELPLPAARPVVDKGPIAGVAALPEVIASTTGARPRPGVEPQGNSDTPVINARPKTTVDIPSPEVTAGPLRNVTRAVTDMAAGLVNAGVQSPADESLPLQGSRKSPVGANQAFIPQSPLPPEAKGYPNADGSVRVAQTFNPYPTALTPQVIADVITPRSPRNHGEQSAPVIAGDKILPVVRSSTTNGDSPVVTTAGSRDTRQILAGLLPGGETPTSRSSVVDRVVNNLELPTPGAPTRKDLQTPAQIAATVAIIKDGQIWTTPKPATDGVVANTPTQAVVRPDGSVVVRPVDAPKGPAQEVGTNLGAGVSRIVNAANDIVNPIVRNQETGLPRAEQPRADQHGHREVKVTDGVNPAQPIIGRNGEQLPAARISDGTTVGDKAGKALEPGLATERSAVRVADTTVPGASTSTANLVRNGEPTVSADKGTVRTADGRVVESGRTGEQIARNTDVARLGESTTRAGETVARAAETNVRGGENIRSGENIRGGGETVRTANSENMRGGENTRGGGETVRTANGAAKLATDSIVRKDDAVVKSNESTAKVGESIVKASESTARVADLATRAVEGGKVADVTARTVDAQGKVQSDATNIANKSIEVTVRASADVVAAQKVNDGAAKLGSDVVSKGDGVVRINDQNAAVRAQDIAVNSIAGDKNGRLADAIIKSADQAGKVDVNQPVKLDGIVRGIEHAAHGQNNQNIQLPGRANDQIAVPGAKAADFQIPGQKIDNVKVDQVVADILNHVRHSAKDQQAGAKILSSLDQTNNAANQQLDARVLLDAAAVRRILDGQGIVYNPATLNTIMEGIKPTGEHAVDYALPSIGSLNLSQIISLGERLQEAVAGAGSETSEPQSKPQLQQHRTKYLVKDGDTLESIAQEKLGDSRLVQLLITINRVLVNYRLEGELKVAYVVPNQYLWLPTDHELEVHKKNFFGKQGKEGSMPLGISSKQNTPLIPPVSFDRTMEVSAEVSASMEDFRPASNSSSSSNPLSGNRMSAGYEVKKYVPSFGPSSGARSGSIADSKESKNSKGSKNEPKNQPVSSESKMSGNLDKVRHAGNRKSVDLDQIEYISTQVTHRQCYQVRQGETLMSIAASLESMGHISMWKLLAKINGFQVEVGGLGKSIENLFAGQFIVLPTTEELNEFKLMEKLGSCTNSASTGDNPVNNAFSCVMVQKQIENPPPPALVALAQGVGGLTTVHKLSSYTRLVLNDLPQLENCFSITVEARWNGQWKPMASYECRHGQTTRHLYNKHGEIKSMELDLPPYVVKEMAREDFIRNWNGYVNSFMGEEAWHFVQS